MILTIIIGIFIGFLLSTGMFSLLFISREDEEFSKRQFATSKLTEIKKNCCLTNFEKEEMQNVIDILKNKDLEID